MLVQLEQALILGFANERARVHCLRHLGGPGQRAISTHLSVDGDNLHKPPRLVGHFLCELRSTAEARS